MARQTLRKPTQRARANQNFVLNLPSRKEEKQLLNPAAATEELKPLERIGPARMERGVNGAIPLCESVRDGVESRNTGCHSLASPLAPGGCVGNEVDDTSGEDEASVKQH